MPSPIDTEPARCPACDVAYTDHLGLNGTCAQLQEARAEVERLRALALHPMGGPPTKPGWYVMLDEDDRRMVVQVYGSPGTTLVVDHGGWGWHTVDAAPAGFVWLARIPTEALEPPDAD